MTATVPQQSHIKFVWITTMRVDIAYACMFCVCHIRVRVCRCVRVCLLACWNATFQFFVFFCSACCCCCRIMSASHRPSSSQALYFVAATVQQQSHSKFVWITTMRVWTLHMRVCSVCYDTCAGTPHISFLFLLCLLLVAAAAAVSCPYHTVPHALKLFTL